VSVIFILIGFSLVVAIGFLVAFIWSVRSGQYEDDYTPSVRVLFDDDIPVKKPDDKDPGPSDDMSKKSSKEKIKPKT